jgi:hypothetical protein
VKGNRKEEIEKRIKKRRFAVGGWRIGNFVPLRLEAK